MTIGQASSRLEQLKFATDAGAAPTDGAQIPCFQVKLTGAHAMNDTNEGAVRTIIRDEMAGMFDGKLVVESGKDIIDEGTTREVCCFWVYAYGSLGSFEDGGITYNVVEWNPDWGVRALPTGRADPMRVKGEVFQWDEVPITEDDFH